MKKIFRDFIALIYPKYCLACGGYLTDNENSICLECLYKLPKTNFKSNTDNAVAELFWGKVDLQYATAILSFIQGSRLQTLLHELKYKQQAQVGEELGSFFADEIEDILNEIDIIIPVPLHKSKQAKRKYNQCEKIAFGIAKNYNIDINQRCLLRTKANLSQTHKGVYERFINSQELFTIKNEHLLQGKHILVVDDIITTGATAAACIKTLEHIKDIKISFIALAVSLKDT